MKRQLLSGAPNEELFGFSQAIELDGLIHVAGQVGKDNETGEMVGEPTLEGRLTQTLANVVAAIEGLGSSAEELVYLQTHVTMDLGANWATIAHVQRGVAGEARAASTVIEVAALASPDYLVEVSAIARAKGAEEHMQRTRVRSGSVLELALGCSQAVRVGNQVFVSGQMSLDANGNVVGDSVGAQLDGAIASFERVVEEAGVRLADVVATHIFVTEHQDAEGFAAICDVHRAVFGASKPTSTLVFVPSLPIAGAKVQITGVAVAAG